MTAGAALEGELDASGLLGRGGANFSTAKKVELLRSQRGHNKVVVVNAMEGEPVGHKDRTLLSSNPHLVLDGAQNLATLIGARHVEVCVSRKDSAVVHHVQRALHERERRGGGAAFELHTPPWRYVAGEESGTGALAERQRDDAAVPRPAPVRLARRSRAGAGGERRDLRPRRVDRSIRCGLVSRDGDARESRARRWSQFRAPYVDRRCSRSPSERRCERFCAKPAPTPIPRHSSPVVTAARGSTGDTLTRRTATRPSNRSAPSVGRRRTGRLAQEWLRSRRDPTRREVDGE